MRSDFHFIRRPLLQILTLLLTISPSHANPLSNDFLGLTNALFGRSTCANPCGWEDQLCCGSNEACYTDSSNQAQCSSTTAAATVVTTASNGYWDVYTTTYVETDLVTMTSVVSSWYASTTTWAAATATASLTCDYTVNETPCGDICCASGQYCEVSGQCAAASNGGSSGYYSSYYSSTASASAALRPTSSTLVVVTATSSPTTTVPFVAPVATGANITLTSTSADNHHGLSGGAIAGIVIGVLLGLLLLGLLLLFCCARGIWIALFGRNRKRTTERTEYIEEHHHRSSGGGAAAGGRTWYGSRPAQYDEKRTKKSGGGFNEMLGIGAGLAGLAAVLGMRRKQDRSRREEDRYTDYSSSYGSYYTSESEYSH